MSAMTFNVAMETGHGPSPWRRVPRCPPTSANGECPKARFARPEPDIINESIPAFFIGRNAEGFWIARELDGCAGGLFLLKSSAISFARARAGGSGCATIFPSERFELDIANTGNRLINLIGPVLRAVSRLRRHVGRHAHTIAKATVNNGFL
jgi:hypothetical protein